MSKFEPKITGAELYPGWARDWCLRNINENLRAFKAEFLRQYFDEGTPTTPVILDDMLPDDPPKATGDDARDALRFKYLAHLRSEGVPILLIEGNDLRAAIDQALPGSQLQEAIDAAMAREAGK